MIRTEGWPWRPTTRVGSLDEIAGVCITRVNDVMLLFKHPGRSRPGFYLQATETQAAAAVIAENVSRITGLPIVEYKRMALSGLRCFCRDFHTMHTHSFPTILSYDALVKYSIIAVVFLFCILFALPPTWLVWSQGRKMQFRASGWHRLLMPFCISYPIAMVLVTTPDSPIPCLIAICGMSLLGIWSSGPQDTLIDGERWVYERRYGWPWRPKTQIGSLDDIAGVFVTRKNSVALKYKYKDDWLRVDMPSGQGMAEATAANISQTTGLPLIACPLQIK